MSNQAIDYLNETRFVGIARGISLDKIGKCAQALYDGGARLFEVTYNQSSADPIGEYNALIGAIRDTMGDSLCLGAGTVLTIEQVRNACDMGAEYIISPNTNEAVISETKKLGMGSIPGAMTPTEVERAWSLGADVVKLFPAGEVGYNYIRHLRGPLSHIKLLASGGVTPDTIPKFLEAGVEYFCSALTIFVPQLVANGDYEEISRLVAAHVGASQGKIL